jgi:hypothetical protein
MFSFTWSWTRNWKFDSCSICVSYSFFFFRHWIAAETKQTEKKFHVQAKELELLLEEKKTKEL